MTQGVIEARAWLVSLACDKAKDHGYPHELWTTRLLARHARENARLWATGLSQSWRSPEAIGVPWRRVCSAIGVEWR
jgi:hypothetical protein